MAAPVKVGETVYYRQNNGNTFLGTLEYSDSGCYVVRDNIQSRMLWRGTNFADLSKGYPGESVCLTCRTNTKPLIGCDECYSMFHTACNIEPVPEEDLCYYCYKHQIPPTIVEKIAEDVLRALKEKACKPAPPQPAAPPPPPPTQTTAQPLPDPTITPIAPPTKKETQTKKPTRAKKKLLAGDKGGIDSCVNCRELTDMQCGRCGTCFCSRKCLVEGERTFRHHVNCYIAHFKISEAERVQGCEIHASIEQRASAIDRLVVWRLPNISNPVAKKLVSTLQPQQEALLAIEKRVAATITTMELLQKTLDSYHTEAPTLYGGDKILAQGQEPILGVCRLPRYPVGIKPHGHDTKIDAADSTEVDTSADVSLERASKRLKIA